MQERDPLRRGNVKRLFDDASTELSSRRTSMSFMRTNLSSERTMMSVTRTSLALITFGFTIYHFFDQLQKSQVITEGQQGRTFGFALIGIGVAVLFVGMLYHVHFLHSLKQQYRGMVDDVLIHDDKGMFPKSMTLILAVVLFLLGVVALCSIIFRIGPLS